MPIKGTFDADFEDFKKEVDASTEKLKAMETEADRVGVAVDKAVTPAGGGGLSTMAEGATQLGQAITEAGSAATTAAPAVGALGTSLDEMAQFGIQSVSASESAAAGFEKMGKSADLTVGQMGRLLKAGVAKEVMEISYSVTRAAMEFFGLDAAVEKAWTVLLGYGDAAQTIAGVQSDQLARASQIAGRAIWDLNEAWIVLNANFMRAQGPAATAKQIYEARTELEILRTSGVMAAITADVDQQLGSLAELATQYGVSKQALAEWQRQLQSAAEQQKAEAAFQKETDKMTAEFLERRDKATKDRKKQEEDWKQLVEDVRTVERNQFADRTVGLLGVSALQQSTSQKNMEAISKEIDAHNKLIKVIQDEVKAAQAVNTARNLGPGTADAGLDAATRRDTELNRIAGLGAKAPTLDLGPLILKTWQDFDAMVIAGAGKGGLAAPPPITVNVSGVFDPASVRQLADVIGNEFIRRTGQDRKLPAR